MAAQRLKQDFVRLYVDVQFCGRTQVAKLMHLIFLKIALVPEQKVTDSMFFIYCTFISPAKLRLSTTHLAHMNSLTDMVLHRKLRNHFHCSFQEKK